LDEIGWVSLVSFGLIAAFTPGPNNISCTSMGVLHGYKKTLPYILGIITGFFFVMLACALIANTLLTLLPSIEGVLRIAGALYVAWLAVETLRASYHFEPGEQKPLGFWRGMMLQVLNPKAIVFGIAIFSTLLLPIKGQMLLQIASAVVFSILVFLATSTWTLFGSAIRRKLRNANVRRAVNIILAVMLFYTAVELSGLFDLVRQS